MMMVHDIRIDQDDGREIIVGATDLQRWQWELEDASHAANAATLVWVSLHDRGPKWAVTETMGLHVSRESPLRSEAIAAIPALLDIAWEIHEAGWSRSEARANCVGRRIVASGEASSEVVPRSILSHASLPVADLARSKRFYDAALAPLGIVCVWSSDRGLGYGPPGRDDQLALFPLEVVGGTTASSPPGFHLALRAADPMAVREFHAAAVKHGGTDEGEPGPRPQYGDTYYAAFVRDPDGHKLEAKVQP